MKTLISKDSFLDEFDKIAARKGLKILRELARAGKTKELGETARDIAGALKVSPQGSTVKRLGVGAEGIADLVAGASQAPPLSVRKLYDRYGPLYSKEQMAEKVNVLRRARAAAARGEEVGDVFAQMYGGLRKTPGGARFTVHEYVPEFKGTSYGAERIEKAFRDPNQKYRFRGGSGGTPSKRLERIEEIRKEVGRRAMSAGEAEKTMESMYPRVSGPTIGDLHSENLVRTPEGKKKVLDFSAIPAHRLADVEGFQTRIQNLLNQIGEERFTKASPQFQDLLARKISAEGWRTRLGGSTAPSTIGYGGMGISGGPRGGQSNLATIRELGSAPRPVSAAPPVQGTTPTVQMATPAVGPAYTKPAVPRRMGVGARAAAAVPQNPGKVLGKRLAPPVVDAYGATGAA